MNVRYDAPKDEIVVEFEGEQLSGAGSPCSAIAKVDDRGNLVAVHILAASHLMDADQIAAADAPSASLAERLAAYEARHGKFNDHLTVEELARRQGVVSFNLDDVRGKWPGERDDGFEGFITELRQPSEHTPA